MGYQMPIVCKELYLACLDAILTLDEYKKITGIDLSKYLYFDNMSLMLVFPKNTKVYLVYGDDDAYIGFPNVGMINRVQVKAYESGNQDGEVIYYYGDQEQNYYFGIKLFIDRNLEFSKENIRITKFEM